MARRVTLRSIRGCSRTLREAVAALPRHGQHAGANPGDYLLLWVFVTDDGAPVAYATALNGDGGVLLLRGCYVAPDFRGRGLQRRLLSARLRYARRAGYRVARTYVAVDNPASLVNVIRAGFRPTSVTDGFLNLEKEV